MSIDRRLLISGSKAPWEDAVAKVPQPDGSERQILETAVALISDHMLAVIAETVARRLIPQMVEMTAERVMQMLDARAEKAKSRRSERKS